MVRPGADAPLVAGTRIALPRAAEATAWAVARGADDLRVGISLPYEAATMQLRVNADGQIEELAPLPMVSAAARQCGAVCLVSGSDTEGRPLLLGLDDDGSIAWRTVVPGATPIRWPEPVGSDQPSIAWQVDVERLECARVELGSGALHDVRQFAVGGPPLAVDGRGPVLWAIWADRDGCTLGRLDQPMLHYVATGRPGDVAVRAAGDGAWFGWLSRNGTAVARCEGNELGPQQPIDLGEAAGGTLRLVDDQGPLVWGRRLADDDPRRVRWVSAFAQPGTSALLVDGLVHDVTRWGGQLAVVGALEIQLLAWRASASAGRA